MSNIVELSIAKAIAAGLRKALSEDEKVLVFGQDIAQLGGVFRVTEGLFAEFGQSRVFNSPIAEAGIVGTAIGLAMRGYRPVAEIQFDGFIYPAFDQITSQLAKITNRHEGNMSFPVVIRVPYGGHIGAVEHHQESNEAYFAHTPGLRVVSPSNPHDAYWMIQEAIASNDPVMFFEPKSRYWPKGDVDTSHNSTPLHSSRTIRPGTDVTLLGHGAMVSVLLQTAELAAEEGTSVEVIDLRTLQPWDKTTVLNSVSKTHRVAIVHEAVQAFGVGAEIAACIAEDAFDELDAPVMRVGAPFMPVPFARSLEKQYAVDETKVLAAIHRLLL